EGCGRNPVPSRLFLVRHLHRAHGLDHEAPPSLTRKKINGQSYDAVRRGLKAGSASTTPLSVSFRSRKRHESTVAPASCKYQRRASVSFSSIAWLSRFGM